MTKDDELRFVAAVGDGGIDVGALRQAQGWPFDKLRTARSGQRCRRPGSSRAPVRWLWGNVLTSEESSEVRFLSQRSR